MMSFRIFLESDEQGFISALEQNPHDLVAWGVFADWLEEQGRPESKILRILMDWASSTNHFLPPGKRELAHGIAIHKLENLPPYQDIRGQVHELLEHDWFRHFSVAFHEIRHYMEQGGPIKRYRNVRAPSRFVGYYTDEKGKKWMVWTPRGNAMSAYARLEPVRMSALSGPGRATLVYDASGYFRKNTSMDESTFHDLGPRKYKIGDRVRTEVGNGIIVKLGGGGKTDHFGISAPRTYWVKLDPDAKYGWGDKEIEFDESDVIKE